MTHHDPIAHGHPPLSIQELAALGRGRIAYVRRMTSEEVLQAFPQAKGLAPGLDLFALLGADGAPILVTDSHEAALANAWEQELETVSVH